MTRREPMSRLLRAICFGSLIAALVGCGAPSPRTCAPGQGAATTTFTLYLGTAIPGRGDLTDREWQSFLDDTVTANLPNGYTILEGRGAWMNPITRRTIKESTKVLVVALPDVPESLAAVNRVRTAYQLKFHQQLVGMVTEQACSAF